VRVVVVLPRMSLPRLHRSLSAVCKNGLGMFVLSAPFFDCGCRCLAHERISARLGRWVSRARGVEWATTCARSAEPS
jgi:hypothetical protein